MNNREWRAFKLSDYFLVKRGKRITENKRIPGKRPLVTAGFGNSGISSFISNKEQEIFPKDTITIDMFANAFYRNYEYSADDNILVLSNSDLSREVKQFIATVFDSTNQFSYGKQYRLSNFKRQMIMLPIKSNEKPDWGFMEKYIREKSKEIKNTYKLPEYHKIIDERGLSEVEWGEYSFEEIFEIKSGVRLTEQDRKIGKTPFVGAAKINNGVVGFVDNINASYDGNILGINYDGEGGMVENFYHPYKALFSDSVKRISLKHVTGNRYLYLFIKTMVLQQRTKYTYGYKFNGQRMKRQIIKLPEKNGNPDYEFMEQYMRHMENKVISKAGNCRYGS